MVEVRSTRVPLAQVGQPVTAEVTVKGGGNLTAYIEGIKYLDKAVVASPDRVTTHSGASDFLADRHVTYWDEFSIENNELIVTEPGEYEIRFEFKVTGGGFDSAITTLTATEDAPNSSEIKRIEDGTSFAGLNNPPRLKAIAVFKNVVTSGAGEPLSPQYAVEIDGQQVDTVDATVQPGDVATFENEYPVSEGPHEACFVPV